MKIKVLVISPQPFFQWRGTPIRVNYLVQVLAGLGYEVDLLTLPIGEKIEHEGVNIIRVSNPFRIRQIAIGPSLSKIFFDFLILVRGVGLIRNKKYAIIHGIEEAGIHAAIFSRLAGGKAIFEKHSDTVSHRGGIFKNLLLKIYGYLELFMMKKVHTIICTGPGLSAQLKNMGLPSRVFQISDIPASAVEPTIAEVAKKRNELLEQHDEMVVTFVGSFAPYQGIDLLMNTAVKVLKRNGNISFVIIGGKTGEIQKWKAILQKQKFQASVHFIGMVQPDSIPVYLAASDILVSPRKNGLNTPLKLIDYLKSGRPIVAANSIPNKLILNDGIALFAHPNPEEMAQAIISLFENPEKRKQLGQKGKEFYAANYSLDRFAEAVKSSYKHILDG